MIKKILISSSIILLSLGLAGCTNSSSVVNKDRYSATVETNTFSIMSETNGKITDLSVKQGDAVKSGQLIVKLDSSSYDIQKRQAEAALNIAKATQSALPDAASDSQKQQAEGAVDQAQAGLDLAQLQINRCSISAQADGVIQDVYANKGEVVSAGTNIAKVMDVNSKYIKIYVEESKRNDVKLNSKINIYENDKKVTEGTITYISSESEFTPKDVETKNEKEKTVFEVKIKLDSNADIASGAMVDAEVK